MKKIFLLSLFIYLLISNSVQNVYAAGDNSLYDYKYIECNGKKVTRLWAIVLKYLANKSYLKCIIDGRSVVEVVHNQPTEPSIAPSPAPTHSSIPSTTPMPTKLPTPPPNQTGSQPSQYWHPPRAHDGLNVHEHGDQVPDWAEDFSKKNFGHPVMFGGDEATPNENILKHQAYKGFLMNASSVDIFIRYHSMSLPHDRSGPLHSYEVYSKDSSGNVSFWQGWIFHGYPEHRDQRMSRRNEQPGYDPLSGITWPGRNQFIISGSDLVDWKNYLTCEQWYGHGGMWSWDLSITICSAATHYIIDEHLTDVTNPSTWKPTGAVGGSRRLEVSHYGPSNPLVGGDNLPFDKWFCVKKLPIENRAAGYTPTWDLTGAVANASSCPSGYLPQFVADTFPKKGVYFETGNTAEKDFPTPGVVIPN